MACLAVGSACTADECCGPGIDGACAACTDVWDPCVNCCTKRCQDGACHVNCALNGESCLTNGDCCSLDCAFNIPFGICN